jgi:starvation-inducible DNA-binding protein
MGFTDKTRSAVIRILNHALVEEIQVSTTTRNFLRHVAGPNFHSLYRLFGDQDRQIGEWLEEIRQRARSAGEAVLTGSDEMAGSPPSAEIAAPSPPRNMIGELLCLHEGVARRLRYDLGALPNRLADRGITDFLVRLVDFHETTAWMLRILQEGSGTGR